MSDKALGGIRVLDLSRVLAGPWCTQILADMGAEVIKIERPGAGDDTRHWGPPWLKDIEGEETHESSYYLSANRGKYSVTVDIASLQGQALVKELARESDIVVENFKTGGLATKGLDYDSLKQINPRLIYCSITGFGQSGPKAKDPGYDYLAQGMSGLMSITGNADGEPGAGPQRVGIAVGDLTTGLYATIGILSALHHRNQTGQGQYIDLALLDTQVGLLGNQALNYLVSGQCPTRTGAAHSNLAPYQPFATADGHIILAIGNDGQFSKFAEEVGKSEWMDDPRFSTNPARVVNRVDMAALIAAETCKRTSDQWMNCLKKIGVPCGPINTVEEVFEEPQIKHREMLIKLSHTEAGEIPLVANPLNMSATPPAYSKAPPTLGEDTVDVLSRVLSKTASEIVQLKENKIV